MSTTNMSKLSVITACTVVISATVLGLMGIDLVLPAVPDMPDIFSTTTAKSQLVLALYVAGSAAGLLLFGSLGSVIGRRKLFIIALAIFAALSGLAATMTSIESLIVVRFFQGTAASGAAVLAPGLIRSMFSELGAIRAIAAMGSIESLAPGLAPILGAWIYARNGWEASFTLTAILAGMLTLVLLLRPKLLPRMGVAENDTPGRYIDIIRNTTFLRYALSHAFVLGGLLTFVFTVPAVIIQTMDGTIQDFIYMQMVGVSTFIIFSNLSGHFVKWVGVERVITLGSVIAAIGGFALLAYAFFGPNDPTHLKYVFWILNTGLGVRGGPGFVRALMAAGGDDDRASALMILFITGCAAGGTAIAAPFIPGGLLPLTAFVAGIILLALLLIWFLPPMKNIRTTGKPASETSTE